MEKHDAIERAAVEAELARFREETVSLKSEVARHTAEVISLKAEVQQLKESAERIARYAAEDRERLAKQVKADSEDWAETKVNEIIKQKFLNLDIDIDKPAKFINRMSEIDKVIEAISSTKKTSAKIIIGSIVGGAIALFWAALKGSFLKP